MERLKRKERKINEKLKVKREEERQKRKKERLKLKIATEKIDRSQIEELQDDVLNFKDSDRESVISYFERGNTLKNVQLDTPTRILNKSNDFLPITYNEKLQKAIEAMEQKKKEEQAENRQNRRTRSVNVVTPRHEIQQ